MIVYKGIILLKTRIDIIAFVRSVFAGIVAQYAEAVDAAATTQSTSLPTDQAGD